jgi:outer membrane biogenesis lipoprotein LolB
VAVDGTYKIEIDTPMGQQEATLTLKTAGVDLSGSMDSALGKQGFTGGTIKGNELAWSLELESPMGRVKLECKGKVTGHDISGAVKVGDFGSSPFKGKKV